MADARSDDKMQVEGMEVDFIDLESGANLIAEEDGRFEEKDQPPAEKTGGIIEAEQENGGVNSDDDIPQISIRNFAEIAERESDEEEVKGIPEIITIADDDEDLATITPDFSSSVGKGATTDRLFLDVVTFDETQADLEMTVEKENVGRKDQDSVLNRARNKLSKLMRRQASRTLPQNNSGGSTPTGHLRQLGPNGQFTPLERCANQQMGGQTAASKRKGPLIANTYKSSPAPGFTGTPRQTGSHQTTPTTYSYNLNYSPATGYSLTQASELTPQSRSLTTGNAENMEGAIRQVIITNNTVVNTIPRSTVAQQRMQFPGPGQPQTQAPVTYPGPRLIKPRNPSPQLNQAAPIRPIIITGASTIPGHVYSSASPQPQPIGSIPVAQTITPTPTIHGPAAPTPGTQVTAGNQKPIPGTIDESDAESQPKTFPSLVVQVKTCLSTKANTPTVTRARTELDTSVRNVLTNSPTKFTEWLMRRGLLKLKHYCKLHGNQEFKLGLYLDINKQPYSGGYTWSVDCCPGKTISVFSGSIFEESKYPPGMIFKLIYHWACQTSPTNILQWVKVSSVYLKSFTAYLRAVCISWLHEYCPPLGGEGKCVEIGVITLESFAETNHGKKSVKVEILGAFDPVTKVIRMKVINSMHGFLKGASQDRLMDSQELGARVFQIVWALAHWVDKRSILLVDSLIDTPLLRDLGFKNVYQCSETSRTAMTNKNVMNYLRNLVPNMFASTLSVISKSIVQQFLDELSWREINGQTSLSTFENILNHISTMTSWRLPNDTSLVTRLQKITQNPFLDWSYTKQLTRCPMNTLPATLRSLSGIMECSRYVMSKQEEIQSSTSTSTLASSTSIPLGKTVSKRKSSDQGDTLSKIDYYKRVFASARKTHSLQSYYYGTVKGDENLHALNQLQDFPKNLKCPMCTRNFDSNGTICRHIYTHIKAVTFRMSEKSVCKVCLREVPVCNTMAQHMADAHYMTGSISCRICEEQLKTEEELVIHMWDLHQRRETPYKCAVCSYASSFHWCVIHHYEEMHKDEAHVMCPLCLKIFACDSASQLKALISHLQAHVNMQRRVRKCPRCVLTFVSDIDLEIHLHNHRSQEPSVKWIPHVLPPNETNIIMGAPPLSKTPLELTMLAASASSFRTSFPPPSKKQKLGEQSFKKKPSNLNVPFTIPIDTTENYSGFKYKIGIPSTAKGICGECGEDIQKENHFVGKLLCSKCRYTTACLAAMDLHHVKNHKPGCKSVKPGMKTKGVKLLKGPMVCKCGFSSKHPTQLANHLISCEKMTLYPKAVAPSEISVNEAPPGSPSEQQIVSSPETPPSDPDASTSEHLDAGTVSISNDTGPEYLMESMEEDTVNVNTSASTDVSSSP